MRLILTTSRGIEDLASEEVRSLLKEIGVPFWVEEKPLVVPIFYFSAGLQLTQNRKNPKI